MNLESTVLQVHIEDIIPNRFQPRLAFDEQALKELSDSIKEHGIIQPLVLRKLGNKYEIIAGERRYKAAQMAGLTTVPAVIANIDDNKSAEVALVENVQRKDLTAIEEARSYKNLLDKGYLTQEQLAKRMGLSQPAVANKLRLLNLDDEVQQALLDEKISERHARTLLTISDKEEQREWLHRIINERLTVRQLDLELKKIRPVDEEDEETSETSGDIPLIEATPSLDDIKSQALDIYAKNKRMSTQDILKPQEIIDEDIEHLDTIDSFNNNELNNKDFSLNIEEPNTASSIIPNDLIEENRNKFFNFSKNNDNYQESNIKEPNTFEVFDSPTNTLTFNDNLPQNEIKKEELQNYSDQNNIESSISMSSNNKFFTPIRDQEVPSIPNPLEKDIDPMKAVDNLIQKDDNSITPTEKDLKTAINDIRDCINKLGDEGFLIDVEEIDFDNNYQITIQIDKDN